MNRSSTHSHDPQLLGEKQPAQRRLLLQSVSHPGNRADLIFPVA